MPNYVKVNDSIYNLYTPAEGVETELDIMFFHGMQTTSSQEAFYKCWTSPTADGEVLWPQTWLAETFPSARIASISFDSHIAKSNTAGRHDLSSLGEALALQIAGLGDYGQTRPLILVGYSVGGLVIKSMILYMFKTLSDWDTSTYGNFLGNLKGIVYYATPHLGSKMTALAKLSSRQGKGKLLDVLTVLNTEVSRINRSFRLWREKANVKTYSFCEAHKTRILGADWMIVEEASARYDTDYFMLVAADHFTVTKPESRVSSRFQVLTQFISDVTGVSRQGGPQEKLPTTFVHSSKSYSRRRDLRLEKTYSIKQSPWWSAWGLWERLRSFCELMSSYICCR